MSSVCVEAFSGVAGPFLPFFGAARAVVTTTGLWYLTRESWGGIIEAMVV